MEALLHGDMDRGWHDETPQRGQRGLTHGGIGIFSLVFRENARHRENIDPFAQLIRENDKPSLVDSNKTFGHCCVWAYDRQNARCSQRRSLFQTQQVK